MGAEAEAGEQAEAKRCKKGRGPGAERRIGRITGLTSPPASPARCGTGGNVCLQRHRGVLPDSELTEYAYALAKADRFQEAIDVLDMLDNPNTPRALNYRGYATRKLGRTDEGIGYYLKFVAKGSTSSLRLAGPTPLARSLFLPACSPKRSKRRACWRKSPSAVSVQPCTGRR